MNVDAVLAGAVTVPVVHVVAVLYEQPRSFQYLTFQSALLTAAYLYLQVLKSPAAAVVGAVAVPIAVVVMALYWPLRAVLDWNNCRMLENLTQTAQPGCTKHFVTAGQFILHTVLPLAAVYSMTRTSAGQASAPMALLAPIYAVAYIAAIRLFTTRPIYPKTAALSELGPAALAAVAAAAAVTTGLLGLQYVRLA